jgi:hypothetical protein
MAPAAAAAVEQHYVALMENIIGFQEKGQVSVLGDFNACVGSATAGYNKSDGMGEPHVNANSVSLPALAWH